MRIFLASVRFLTLLPVGRGGATEARDLARSMAWFPLVGGLMGLALAGAHIALAPLLPSLASSVIVVLLLVVLTGGLHLDGLADTCDGFYAGRNKEEILQIMKDSRIGAIGAISLSAALLLKVSLLSGIPSPAVPGALIVMPAAGRWGMVLAARRSLPAREEGLAHTVMGGVGWLGFLAATIFTSLLGIGLLGWPGAVACLSVAVGAYGMSCYAKRKIGGLTGDVFGAVSEVSEILVLLVAAATRPGESLVPIGFLNRMVVG